VRKRSRRNGEKKADFATAVIKQNLVAQDLMRFNIKTVFVKDFPDITRLIETLEHRFRRRTVFISGSADDYGSWGRAATEEFLSAFARAVISRDLRIASGFGLGLGSAVVTGAVQQIYSTKQRSVGEQLVLRPFPVGIEDTKERQKTFVLYREELIAQAGIAIFIMGNKTAGGKLVNADGVLAEFDLAKTKGLYLIPVGSSGSLAKELWSEVMGQFDTYFPNDAKTIRPWMEALGKTVENPRDLLDPLLKLITHLSKE
jgi:hypothetical protein